MVGQVGFEPTHPKERILVLSIGLAPILLDVISSSLLTELI